MQKPPIAARLAWPFDGGLDAYPITRGSSEHEADGQQAAVDFGAPTTWGTPILAPHTGWIYYRGIQGDCGETVDIEWGIKHHYRVRFCHLGERYTIPGSSYTRKGAWVASVGSSGLTTGPHLHLAYFIDGVRQRPEDYLYA